MKYSLVIPAKNEAESITGTVDGLVQALEAAQIDYEVLVVDDASTDETRVVVERIGATNPRVRCHPSHNPPGFGFAVRAGLDVFTGDAVAVVMADGSDSPDDVVSYYRVLEDGYDCAFGSRFVSGSHVSGYPRSKLIMNRVVNFGIRMLFRHGYNDTTNAFARGHNFKVVPISWTNRAAGSSKLNLQEMGSRYLFIVLYVLLERHLTRGDYKKRSVKGATGRRADT